MPAETEQPRKNFITRALAYVPHITGVLLVANFLGWWAGEILSNYYTCHDCKVGTCPWWVDAIQTLPRWIPKVQAYLPVLISTKYYDTYCLMFTFGHGIFLINLAISFSVFLGLLIKFKKQDSKWHILGIASNRVEAGKRDIKLFFISIICLVIIASWVFWGAGLRAYYHPRLDSVKDWWFTFKPAIGFAFIFPAIAYLIAIGPILITGQWMRETRNRSRREK